MPPSEIGDKTKLRKISDILLARGAQMLPSTVNVDEWQPVISYGVELDSQDYWIIEQQIFPGGTDTLFRSVGASNTSSDFELPAGFIYTLQYMEMTLDFNGAPIDDEFLRLELYQGYFDIPSSSPTERRVRLFNMGINNPPPAQVRANQVIYKFTYPYLSYVTILPSGLNQIADARIPVIEILAPDSLTEPGRSKVYIELQYLDTLRAAKNYPAPTDFTYQMVFKRKPILDFVADGQV